MEQPSFFDPDNWDAMQAARRGMQKAESHQTDEWKNQVVSIIRQVAERQQQLTSDDVYKVLESRGLGFHCARVIGPLMIRAAKLGYIESTHTVRHSERASMHAAWVTVWRSLVQKEQPSGNIG